MCDKLMAEIVKSEDPELLFEGDSASYSSDDSSDNSSYDNDDQSPDPLSEYLQTCDNALFDESRRFDQSRRSKPVARKGRKRYVRVSKPENYILDTLNGETAEPSRICDEKPRRVSENDQFPVRTKTESEKKLVLNVKSEINSQTIELSWRSPHSRYMLAYYGTLIGLVLNKLEAFRPKDGPNTRQSARLNVIHNSSDGGGGWYEVSYTNRYRNNKVTSSAVGVIEDALDLMIVEASFHRCHLNDLEDLPHPENVQELLRDFSVIDLLDTAQSKSRDNSQSIEHQPTVKLKRFSPDDDSNRCPTPHAKPNAQSKTVDDADPVVSSYQDTEVVQEIKSDESNPERNRQSNQGPSSIATISNTIPSELEHSVKEKKQSEYHERNSIEREDKCTFQLGVNSECSVSSVNTTLCPCPIKDEPSDVCSITTIDTSGINFATNEGSLPSMPTENANPVIRVIMPIGKEKISSSSPSMEYEQREINSAFNETLFPHQTESTASVPLEGLHGPVAQTIIIQPEITTALPAFLVPVVIPESSVYRHRNNAVILENNPPPKRPRMQPDKGANSELNPRGSQDSSPPSLSHCEPNPGDSLDCPTVGLSQVPYIKREVDEEDLASEISREGSIETMREFIKRSTQFSPRSRKSLGEELEEKRLALDKHKLRVNLSQTGTPYSATDVAGLLEKYKHELNKTSTSSGISSNTAAILQAVRQRAKTKGESGPTNVQTNSSHDKSSDATDEPKQFKTFPGYFKKSNCS